MINFSIVIITHDREQMVKRTVESVFNDSEAYDGDVEVLVVSSFHRKLFEEFDRVEEIHVPDATSAAKKRNIGFRMSTEDWIVFIDDDCILKSGSLETISKYIVESDKKVAGFGGIVKHEGERKVALKSCEGSVLMNCFHKTLDANKVNWIPTALAVFKKDVLKEVGGFDSEVFNTVGGEDIDLCIRINDIGYVIKYIPEVLVYHEVDSWNSIVGNFKRFFKYGKSETYLKRKHREYNYFKPGLIFNVLLVSFFTLFYIWQFTNFNIYTAISFYIPLFFMFSSVPTIIDKKSLLYGVLLKLYYLVYETGSLYAALFKFDIKSMFSSFSTEINKSEVLKFQIYEFFDYLALILLLLLVYVV